MKKLLLFLIPLFLPLTVFAVGEYVPLEPLPGVPTGNVSFPALLNGAFTLLILLGSALAVLMLTIGGIQYMTSEAVGQKEAGRERIRNAILGLLLLLSIYLILSTINPQLLNFNLNNIKPVGSEAGRADTLLGGGGLPPASTVPGGRCDPATFNGVIPPECNKGYSAVPGIPTISNRLEDGSSNKNFGADLTKMRADCSANEGYISQQETSPGVYSFTCLKK